jgi:hypothetical protein
VDAGMTVWMTLQNEKCIARPGWWVAEAPL